MYFQLIQNKVTEWFKSHDCTMRQLIDYIVRQGMMRDAQIEAVKTYLYLKIVCGNRPLWQLFTEGQFNAASDDYESMPLTTEAREILKNNKAAEALFQYSRLTDRNNRQLSPVLEEFIKQHPQAIDYEQAFKDIFYGVDYPDFIYSLPMGAGKTFLMATFIYIDLYLAMQEPDNKAFAHNFMIFAPSGLKNSIVPSLKHIQDFDPTWILPDPTASQIKKIISFEVLDEQKTAKNSNLVKNPNAQKINNHQPLSDLFGLVAVTNAEKVVLDKIDKDRGLERNLYTEKEWNAMKNSNELREIIRQIPHLAIFIDEVHHASDGEIKLRKVVSDWMKNPSFNSVYGFSGTPYLKSAEKVTLAGLCEIKNTDISNVVYNYPLISGIGNFLKRPKIKTTDNSQEAIITDGVNEFFDLYADTIYSDGTCAKLAIYCSRIENLEEVVYPLVASIVSSRSLNPQETILKYHGGNKDYPVPAGSATDFAALDTDFSKYRIVLLAQIGKEGWDCKSLTSVILPQKGACPQNMVLQTSCRCLRQVERGNESETALIWLNKDNADTLNKELIKQQNTTIDAVNMAADNYKKRVDRYIRKDVPPIDFFQLKIQYNTLVIESTADTRSRLSDIDIYRDAATREIITHEQDLEGNMLNDELHAQTDEDELLPITYRQWLLRIMKESMGMLAMHEIKKYDTELRRIFGEDSTLQEDGTYRLLEYIDQKRLRSIIRQAFVPKRSIEVRKEVIPENASLLKVDRLETPLFMNDDSRYYPDQPTVRKIVDADKGNSDNEDLKKAEIVIEQMKQMNLPGWEEMAIKMRSDAVARDRDLAVKDQTYHYLPYHFDSGFEIKYFSQRLLAAVRDKGLEVYFNGDDQLTDFRIACYSKRGDDWRYIGRYVPDFLMIQRDDSGKIFKVLIIETKGEGFAAKFKERRDFMSEEFVRLNNDKFGYQRFDFLYVEDTLSSEQQTQSTLSKINTFFNLK